MRKTILWTVCIILSLTLGVSAQNKTLRAVSPDGRIGVDIKLTDKIYYTVSIAGTPVMIDNVAGLKLRNEVLGQTPLLTGSTQTHESNEIKPLVPLKYASVRNDYNKLLLNFKGNYAVEFRIFNDGIAYRFITNKKGKIEIMEEEVQVAFPEEYTLHLQPVGGFHTPYEEPYEHVVSTDFKKENKMSVLPVLIDTRKGYKILISESDLWDYPVMLVRGTGKGFDGAFDKCTKKYKDHGDRGITVLEKADYIASTDGKRTFPWRYFVITEQDGQLIENTMTLRLASKSAIQDPSWIKPGQTVWDWWNYAMPYGVEFEAGRNQATYKYFIDFAAENNIPYSLIDEGWAKNGVEPFETNPLVNMRELIAYANQKQVKLILWLPWLAAQNHLDSLFKIYKKWGIAGVKVDFMERNDQWMVNYYERVAKEAADNHLLVLFHGSFKPAGLEYRYPNILSYEGVRGLEWKGAATADNGIWIPFMRNAVGPMDYTPGAMSSMQPDYYVTSDYNPQAVGTRALQLAHFVVFESGIQMLADNPTHYRREKECFEFIKQVPVTWDETRVLTAVAGEYVVVAKRKSNRWFIGAMTNGKQAERNLEITLDFLSSGQKYQLTSFEDGANAKHIAIDYKKRVRTVQTGDKLSIKMVKNGGWAGILE